MLKNDYSITYTGADELFETYVATDWDSCMARIVELKKEFPDRNWYIIDESRKAAQKAACQRMAGELYAQLLMESEYES